MPDQKRRDMNIALRQAREAQGWTREQVAHKLDTNPMSVYRWESGRALPSPYYRQKLAEMYDQSLAALGLLPDVTKPDDELPDLAAPALLAPFGPLAGGLIGREAIVDTVRDRLMDESGAPLTALSGLPGVGKTVLAVALIHDPVVQSLYPDGVLWAGLGPSPSVAGLLREWALKLGYAVDTLAQLTDIAALGRMVREGIGARRLILVIDDAWRIDDALALKVGGPECATLLTTRFLPLAYQFAQHDPVMVPELSATTGFALLTRLAPTVTANYAEQARDLVQAVGGLPLALTVLGHYLQLQSLSQQPRRVQAALARVADAKQRLQIPQPQAPLEISSPLPAGNSLSLHAVISMSVTNLDSAARELLNVLAVFPAKPNTVSEEAALAASGQELSCFIATLDALVDHGLVESVGAGRYAVHQTIADYALLTPPDRQVIIRRARYYADWVASHPAALVAWQQEERNVAAAFDGAYAVGVGDIVSEGALTYATSLQIVGRYDDAAHHLDQALAALPAAATPNLRCRMLEQLALLAKARGDYLAMYNYAQEIQDRADQPELVISALWLRGTAALNQGSRALAETCFVEGLALARDCADDERIMTILKSYGSLLFRLDRDAAAVAAVKEGLSIARKHNWRVAIPGFLISLATIYGKQGHYPEVGDLLLEALAVADEIGSRENLCWAYSNLGTLNIALGDIDQARDYLQAGLDIARDLDHPERISGILTNLVEVAQLQGDMPQAEAYAREGIALARAIGHEERLCGLLHYAAITALRQSRWHEAEECLQESEAIAHRLTLRRKLGDIYITWGELLHRQQCYDAAMAKYQEAFRVGQEIRHPDIMGLSLFGTAQVAAAQGNLMQARTWGTESEQQLSAIGHAQAQTVRQWLATLPAQPA